MSDDLSAAATQPDAAITVDGRTVPVAQGQTLGAAMVADGVRAWRTTRSAERPRGWFCGMGVCMDCLVTVDGRPNVRACTEVARPGAVVTSQRGTGRTTEEPGG